MKNKTAKADGPAEVTPQEAAELRAQNEQLLARLAAIEDRLGAAGAPIACLPGIYHKTPYEMQIERLNERRLQMQQVQEQNEAALQDGAKQYRVSIEGEPRMVRMVGAGNAHEAQAKYLAYFGIRSTGTKPVDVEPCDPNEPAIASPTLGGRGAEHKPAVSSDRRVMVRHVPSPDDGYSERVGTLRPRQAIQELPRPNCPDCGTPLPPLPVDTITDRSQPCQCGSFFRTYAVPSRPEASRTAYVIRSQ